MLDFWCCIPNTILLSIHGQADSFEVSLLVARGALYKNEHEGSPTASKDLLRKLVGLQAAEFQMVLQLPTSRPTNLQAVSSQQPMDSQRTTGYPATQPPVNQPAAGKKVARQQTDNQPDTNQQPASSKGSLRQGNLH